MNAAGAQAAAVNDTAARAEVDALLRDPSAVQMVFHPVWRLEAGTVLALEALARMHNKFDASPQPWFDKAAEVGRLTELELVAARKAVARIGEIPEEGFLFVNASPNTVIAPEFLDLVHAPIAERLILDLSVDAPVRSYEVLVESVRELRRRGVRISIDDAGDDRASWSRVNHLEPEVIKLRPSVTRALIDDHGARKTARHFLAFAADIHADVIAEAVETEEEQALLIDLGVKFGQGFLWGRPADLP